MEDGFLRPSSILHFLSSFCLSAAGKNCREEEPGDKNGDACQLSRREAVVDVVRRIITAKKFDDGTEDGVADEIGCEHLAVKFFMLEQPREAEVKGEIQQGIVNFRR